MSALGQKRTLAHVHIMSALPPKADIIQDDGHVRFVPKADSCSAAIGGINALAHAASTCRSTMTGRGQSFDADPMDKPLTEKQAEIERIEEAVSHIRFPLTFSDQLYNLRSHIEIVQRKIATRRNTPEHMAAE